MKIDLGGKKAIVSGSTEGIGLAAARGLAEAGAEVVINGRSGIEAAVKKIKDALPGAKVSGIAADLGTAEGCDAVIKACPACDILVNNLGIYAQMDFFEIPDSEWEKFFQINVMSGVRLSRAYIQGMVKNGWGRVIFLGSSQPLISPRI